MVSPQLLTAIGAACAMVLACLGSASASFPAGLYVVRTTQGWRSWVPLVVAGVLGLYGLIVALVLCQRLQNPDYALHPYEGYKSLCAGLTACLAADWACQRDS